MPKPDIEDKCEFITTGKHILLRTNAHEHKITISDLLLSKEQAAGLAWLVNCDEELKVEIKIN